VCDCQLTRRDAIVGTAIGAAAVAWGLGLPTRSRASAAAGRSASTRGVALTGRPGLGPALPAQDVAPGLSIYPRGAWGADLPPKGPIGVETPQFLLVHHTASPNDYASAVDLIRSVYAFHTGPAKGWTDVCYEFFIGRDGDVWEGRSGALAGPVVADATGGSQGFAQLVCLLGDFTDSPPTAPAQASLIKVLAWLANRNLISLMADASATFVSRGSQRWKAGVTVTTPTIAGHRDMSYTECPGNQLYPLLSGIRSFAAAQAASWATGLEPARRLGPVAP
jgi:hypothetical protein